MVDASIGVLIAISVIDYILFYIALNLKYEELQVLFFALGVGLMTVTFHLCGLIAKADTLTAVETTFKNLVQINSYIFYFIVFFFFILLIKKAIETLGGIYWRKGKEQK